MQILAIFLMLVSCSDDPVLDDPQGNPGGGNHTEEGIGEKFSLTLRIPLSTGNSSTRSYTGISKGSNNEIFIKDVRTVFYGSDDKVKYYQDLNIALGLNASDEIEVTGSDVFYWGIFNETIFIQSKARSIPRDNYDLLIIVNPNQDIKNRTEVNQLKSNLEGATFDTTVANSMYDTRTVADETEPVYFLMLNSQGFLAIQPENFYDTREQAENNPVHATVERVAAKVESIFTGSDVTRSTEVAPFGRFVMLLDYNNQLAAPWGDDYDIPEDCIPCPVHGCNGTFNRKTKRCSAKPYIHTYDGLGLVSDRVRYMVATDLSWEVDIVNKKSHWLRQLTYKAGDTVMEQQGDTDRQNFYAEDPNFSGLSGSGSTNLTNNFSYLSNGGQLVPGASGSTAKRLYPPQLSTYKYYNYWSWDKADTQPAYIPENTMSQSEQKRDVVTRVVFRAVLKREQFGESDTEQNPTAPAPIGDFFVFKGGNTDIEDYKYNNYNKDNTTFFILRPEDVAIYASASTTENIHIYLRDGILEAINQFKTDHPGFNFSNWQNEEPAQSANLSFYKNGEIYYEVPIEHFSVTEAQGAGKYGRFGVVRNNWYKLNIENIVSIGAPVLPTATSELIEPGTRYATPKTKSSSDIQVRNQSIIF